MEQMLLAANGREKARIGNIGSLLFVLIREIRGKILVEASLF
jgi:hypothetical protein